jgi:hypothetical protein
MTAAKNLLKAVALYLVLVDGGTVVFTLLTPLVGYAPFGDRPPAGWSGGVSFLKPWGIKLVLSWGLLLTPYAAVVGVVLYGLARAFDRLGFPRLVIAISGALTAAVLSGLIVSAMGWYIALGSLPASASVVLGALYGAVVLPRWRREPRGRPTTPSMPEADSARAPAVALASSGAQTVLGTVLKTALLVLVSLVPLGLLLFGVFGFRGPVRWEIPGDYRGWGVVR